MSTKHVYVIGTALDAIKIGITGDIQKRLRYLQTGSPLPLCVRASCVSDNAERDEAEWHLRLSAYHCLGEWHVAPKRVLCAVSRMVSRGERPRFGTRRIVHARTPLFTGISIAEKREKLIKESAEIYELKMPARVTGSLVRMGITRIAQLVAHRPKDLIRQKGFGRLSCECISRALKTRGLSLRENGLHHTSLDDDFGCVA